MDNEYNRLLFQQKLEWEEQRRKHRETARISAAVIFPLFVGLSVIFAFALWKSLDTVPFLAASAIMLVFTILSGFIEKYRINTVGTSGGMLSFSIVQIILTSVLCVLLIFTMESLG
ncbi:MAG TPA: hypothetical protein ENH40_04355 [Nitrospirae bacterium]|nr:hypothetical protein [Nitrospirota bacterium]